MAFSKIKGIGIKHAKHILSQSDLKSFFIDPIFIKHEKTGLSLSFLRKINFEKALEIAEIELEQLQQKNISFSFFKNDDYPYRLKQCCDCPIVIYHRGIAESNPKKIVSIVGTRKATNEGKTLTRELISVLSELNVSVVSGLAYGIDVTAHQACLDFKTPTFAVMGHGFDYIYPYAHKKILKEIIASGKIFSEHAPEISPKKFLFAKRNRIIAGLSDATIIIESGEKGGSMITAKLANDYSRDVFAFPGNVKSTSSLGCNKLIQQDQAHLLIKSTDILNFMSWEREFANKSSCFKKNTPELHNNEKAIYTLLKQNDACNINEIYQKLNIEISYIQSSLINLELMDLIKSIPGQKFLLK